MAQYIIYGNKVDPAQEIISLERAKENSRIEFKDEDTLLQLFVDAATSEIENFIGGPVVEREVKIEQNTFGAVNIPFKAKDVTAVEWLDAAGTVTAIPEEDWDYFLNEVNIGTDRPSDFNRLRVTCTAGFAYADMPADIQRAALLIFSHADTYRENMPLKLNTSAQALLRPYKNY